MLRSIFTLLLCVGLMACAKEDSVTRRQAFRKAFAENPAAAIDAGLKDSDAVIRKYCVYQDFLRNGADAVTGWKKLLADPDEEVQLAVVECLGKLPSENPQRQSMGKALAEKSKYPLVVRYASRLDAAAFNFYRTNVRLKDDPTFDHIAEVKETIELPDDRWVFSLDPAENGHAKNWFAVDYDDHEWPKVKCADWESQGFPGYDGVAWYRIRFVAPPKGDCVGADLKFGAVDEQAWVWLNGTYLGCHDIGLAGWNKPFDVDCTKELIWGEKNVLVVRVQDAADAGGIWKPITLNVLK